MSHVSSQKPSQKPSQPSPSPQQIKRQQREKVKNLKHQIYELEKTNCSHLYLYRYSEDWWRMGGNSALFYYHLISKQLNTLPTLSLDRDYYDTWKTGVISIHNINTLLDKFSRAGFKLSQTSDVITITLQKKFTPSEVETIQNIETAKEKEFNRLSVPKLMYPGIHAKLRELTEPIIESLIKLHTTRYRLYGHEGAELCWQLKRDFISMTNGRLPVMLYFKKSLVQLEQLSDWLAAVRDYHIFNNDANLRHINNIVNLRQRITKEYNTLKKHQSSPSPAKTPPHDKTSNQPTLFDSHE